MERTDALGRRARGAHRHTSQGVADADARTDLGDVGTTVGDLYAYAWDRRRGAYNVVRLYARADARVTRWMVGERALGIERERKRVPWSDNVAQPARSVRTFAPLSYTEARIDADAFAAWNVHAPMTVGWIRAPQRTRPNPRPIARGNPDAERTHAPHVCPPVKRERDDDNAPRTVVGVSVRPTCARQHYWAPCADACARDNATRKREREAIYRATVARINAREC